MPIEFSLSKYQRETLETIRFLAATVIRPKALEWDRDKAIPDDFLRGMVEMGVAVGGTGGPTTTDPSASIDATPDDRKSKQAQLTTVLFAEAMAWGDPGLLLSMPGPGLGGPPVRASGTPEQKERFLGIFRNMSKQLHWGAYALTEPGAGSDVAGIRTSCRKDGDHWVLNGRKCYITNGARAAWNVVFATVDPALGRAGHRAFVIEKGTPGFSVGKIEDKMGLRASETAELVFEDCRVPAANLLGGEEKYTSKEGFMTAMKTFDNTRPLVAAMALGIGQTAFDIAKEHVRAHYVLARPIPRYSQMADRLARIGQRLTAARTATWRAAWMADNGVPNAKEASMAKALGGQAAIFACTEAIEICGADGTVAKEDALLEKCFRDIKVFDIFEGTGQIQRVVIAKRMFADLKAF
jgi:acyl-CoA dehydrogenase